MHKSYPFFSKRSQFIEMQSDVPLQKFLQQFEQNPTTRVYNRSWRRFKTIPTVLLRPPNFECSFRKIKFSRAFRKQGEREADYFSSFLKSCFPERREAGGVEQIYRANSLWLTLRVLVGVGAFPLLKCINFWLLWETGSSQLGPYSTLSKEASWNLAEETFPFRRRIAQQALRYTSFYFIAFQMTGHYGGESLQLLHFPLFTSHLSWR